MRSLLSHRQPNLDVRLQWKSFFFPETRSIRPKLAQERQNNTRNKVKQVFLLIFRKKFFIIIWHRVWAAVPQGVTKPLSSACPGQVSSCAGQARSPWQLARRAIKVAPETLKMYTFSDCTLRYFELVKRRLPFVVHSKGEKAHSRKKSGQVRINSGQVGLSHSLPQRQAENFFSVAPCSSAGALSSSRNDSSPIAWRAQASAQEAMICAAKRRINPGFWGRAYPPLP